MLSPEELLAGSGLTYDVEVPAAVLRGDGAAVDGAASGDGGGRRVRLRPLTVADLQLIARAARESDTLVATLMVQRALLEPALTVPQVAGLSVGLLQFLLERVNRISGITGDGAELADAVQAPLARAAFVLAREFGWTPQQVSELTLGQILVHLRLLQEEGRG